MLLALTVLCVRRYPQDEEQGRGQSVLDVALVEPYLGSSSVRSGDGTATGGRGWVGQFIPEPKANPGTDAAASGAHAGAVLALSASVSE